MFQKKVGGVGHSPSRAPRPAARIEIEERLRVRAKKLLDAMLAMSGGTMGQGDIGGVKV